MITLILLVASLICLAFASFGQTTSVRGINLFPLGVLFFVLSIALPLMLALAK